jgi:hypothetical protein
VDSRAVALGLCAAAAVLAVAYIVQAATPLRIEDDSTEYLVIAAWIADGHGIPSDAAFPPGLPFMLASLDSLGIARSWAITLLNLVFLGIGLGATAHILRRGLGYSRNAVLGVCLLTALAFAIVRATSHPLSDIPFFGLSLAAIAFSTEARRRASVALLLPAGALTLAAISVRTLGVALVPAVLAALPPRARRVGLPALLVVGSVGFAVFGPRRYVSEALDEWRSDPLRRLVSHSWDLLGALGELALNVPHERVPDALAELYPLVGLGMLIPLAGGAWLLRHRAPVEVGFVASVTVILIVWPFTDSRLLLPTTPLLIACVVAWVQAMRPRRWLPSAAWAWVAVFAVAGITSLAVSTRITFAGDRFPELYNENLRSTYRVAWGQADGADMARLQPRALWALRRYEPRAVGDPGVAPSP